MLNGAGTARSDQFQDRSQQVKKENGDVPQLDILGISSGMTRLGFSRYLYKKLGIRYAHVPAEGTSL
jgi:hypothetical protein